MDNTTPAAAARISTPRVLAKAGLALAAAAGASGLYYALVLSPVDGPEAGGSFATALFLFAAWLIVVQTGLRLLTSRAFVILLLAATLLLLGAELLIIHHWLPLAEL